MNNFKILKWLKQECTNIFIWIELFFQVQHFQWQLIFIVIAVLRSDWFLKIHSNSEIETFIFLWLQRKNEQSIRWEISGFCLLLFCQNKRFHSFLSLYIFEESVFIFQFLSDKMHNYVLFDIIVHFIIQKLKNKHIFLKKYTNWES